MDFDGFLYIFAVIGIAITAAAASLGVALVVTMARLTYARFKLVTPLLFSPMDVIAQRIPRERVPAADEPANEPVSRYMEKTRLPGPSNGGRKGYAGSNEIDVAATE